jgi:hypothetical protein
MAVTPWLASYPYSDPIFQYFTVQQYLTVAGVSAVQTYDAPAPGVLAEKAPEVTDERPVNDEGESLNKDGSVSKNQPAVIELKGAK